MLNQYRGVKWYSDRDLSLQLDRGTSYVYYWRIRGKSHEEIIDSIFNKEYKGIKWFSDSDLSIKLGKSAPYVKRHLNNGESHEQIINRVLKLEEFKWQKW